LQTRYETWARHAGRHGTAKIRDEAVINRLQLGAWAAEQRQARVGGTLPATTVADGGMHGQVGGVGGCVPGRGGGLDVVGALLGPRRRRQGVEADRDLLPCAAAVVEAGRRPRARTTDLLIAVIAHAHSARLYTCNASDFVGADTLIEVVSV